MSAQPFPGQRRKPAAVITLPYWLREFALLRLAVATCVGAAGISMAAIFASHWYMRDADDTLAQARLSRDAAYDRYAHVENEKQDIRRYQPPFLLLREHALVGEENRLAWLDAIRQTQEQHKLLPLTYEIYPQQPFKLAAPMDLGDYLLRGSRMTIHLDLLHEMDLFTFINDLHQRSYFAMQDCVIKRQGPSSAPNAPTLSADCTLNWITLTPASVIQKPAHRKGKR